MQPRTKLEKQVTDLSAKLRPITEKQLQWGEEHSIPKYGHRSRGVMCCLECGHSWKPEGTELFDAVLGVDCPECGRHLKMLQNYSTNCTQAEYFHVWQTVSGFQVIRTIFVRKMYRLSKPTCTITSEVMQHWIDQDGKVVWLSKSIQGLSSYADQWVFHSDISVKHVVPYTGSDTRYWLRSDFVYPNRSVLPAIKRNGFSGHLHGFNPVSLFQLLLSDPHAETLFKAAQFGLLSQIKKANERWASVKICLRNGYSIKDANIWFDHLDLLQYFGKDLRNAKYVCPEDLKTEHDKLVNKKRRILEAEAAEKKRQKAATYERDFLELKGHLLGICFGEGDIKIKTLDSVDEYRQEGDLMHHCVFTNAYFLKKGSLCLSARIDEQPVETIELDLEQLKVTQAYGKFNNRTKYHDQILDLVNKNIPIIAKRLQTATI